jgi:DNA-binding NtrC family response regulator
MPAHIAIVDDDIVTLKRLRRLLEKEGHRLAAFSNPRRALHHLATAPCDLLISDIRMPGMTGLELLSRVRGAFPSIECLLITGYPSLDDAVDATKEGAFHYLAKPFTPEELRVRVAQALAQHRARRTAARSAADRGTTPESPIVIGQSAAIRQVEAVVRQIAPTACNVLITGDSGCGKELVARALHALSPRSRGPFVAFNCGALAETLMDNELFGHEKGAYTGADADAPGLLETASGGTLFLDEIGEMPPAMQVKLLRVMQEREVVRVGGRTPRPLDLRNVSATSKDLKRAVAEGAFRKDFYFRINVVHIPLPPLREHREDIPLLAYHILQRFRRANGHPVAAISAKAMEALAHYAFPGNVRELENILERAVAVCPGDIIRLADLPRDLTELELQAYEPTEGPLVTLSALERDYIAHVLRLTGGVRSRAAAILGIDRASLWRKIKKLGLE